MCEALLALGAHVKGWSRFEEWARAVRQVEKQQPQVVVGVRDFLLRTAADIKTTEDCVGWCSTICNFCSGNVPNQLTLATIEIRDALLSLRAYANTAGSCEAWCSSVCHLTRLNVEITTMFGTVEIRDALLALNQYVSTANSCVWWCAAVQHVADGVEANKVLLRTPAMVAAVQRLEQLGATTEWATEWWGKANGVMNSEPVAAAAAAAESAPAAPSNKETPNSSCCTMQ